MSYKNLAQDVPRGQPDHAGRRLISMKVVERTETDVLCLVENGGLVKDRKGVNVPGVHLSMPYMSARTGRTSSSASRRGLTSSPPPSAALPRT